MNHENIERVMKGTDFGTAGIPPLMLTKGYVELMLGASYKTLLIVDHPPLRNLYYSELHQIKQSRYRESTDPFFVVCHRNCWISLLILFCCWNINAIESLS
jgi:hypothetical protein